MTNMIDPRKFPPRSGIRLHHGVCFALFLGALLLLGIATLSATAEPEQGVAVAKPALTDLSPEELAVQLPPARAELVALRRQAQARRQQIEAGDEAARALNREMRELRLQLQAKNKQLQSLIAADEEWAALHQQESVLLTEFRKLAQQANGETEDQDELDPQENLQE